MGGSSKFRFALAFATLLAGTAHSIESLPPPLPPPVGHSVKEMALPEPPASKAVEDQVWRSTVSAKPAAKLLRPLYIESIPRGSYTGFLNPGSVVRRVSNAQCWGEAVEVVSDIDGVVKNSGPYCTVGFYLDLAMTPNERGQAPKKKAPAPDEENDDDRVLSAPITVYPIGKSQGRRLAAGTALRLVADKSCWGVVVTIVGEGASEFCASEKWLVEATGARVEKFPGESDAEVDRDTDEIRVERHRSSYEMGDLVSGGGRSTSRAEKKESKPEEPPSERVKVDVGPIPRISPAAPAAAPPAAVPSPRVSSPARQPVLPTPAQVARHVPLREEKPPEDLPVPPPFPSRLYDALRKEHRTPANTRIRFPAEWLKGAPVTIAKNEASGTVRSRMDGPTASLYLPSDRCKAGVLQFGDQFCMVLAVGPGELPEDRVFKGQTRSGVDCYYAYENTFNGPLPVSPPPRYKLVHNGKREDTARWGIRDVVELHGVERDGTPVPPPDRRGDFRAHSGRDDRADIEERPTTGCLRLERSCQDRFLEWVDRQKGNAVMDVEEVEFSRDDLTNERNLFGRILNGDVTKGMR